MPVLGRVNEQVPRTGAAAGLEKTTHCNACPRKGTLQCLSSEGDSEGDWGSDGSFLGGCVFVALGIDGEELRGGEGSVKTGN